MAKPSNTQWSTKQMIILFAVVIILQHFVPTLYENIFPNSGSSSLENDKKSYKFGHDAKKHFALDPSYKEFQWGSYGNCPKEVMDYQQSIRYKIESCPSCWMGQPREDELNGLIAELAKYLNVENPEDLVFIINASNGINAVLNSISRVLYTNYNCGKSKDKPCKILQFSTAFDTVKNTLNIINSHPSSPVNQLITFNITRQMLSDSDVLLTDLDLFLQKNQKDIIFATFDHMIAYPNAIYPVKRLTQLFRKYKVLTFIDGAHAFGQIKVDMSDMDPDIWLGNGHKWMYSTRGSTVMYIKRELHHLMWPQIITNRYKTKKELINESNAIQQQFHWQGTMDDSIWMSLKGGLEFRKKFGDDEMIEYMHNLAISAGDVIVDIWNTSLLVYNKENIGAMINPILPNAYGIQFNKTMAKKVVDLLYEKYNTIVYIKDFDGFWYMRLMIAIYHEIDDYKWIAHKTLDVIQHISIIKDESTVIQQEVMNDNQMSENGYSGLYLNDYEQTQNNDSPKV